MKVLKRAIVMMFVMVLLGANNVSAQQNISVVLDGTKLSFDVQPQIIDGRTMVPMRAIFEALGAEITWDSVTQIVGATKGNRTIIAMIGHKEAYIDGTKHAIDVPPLIIDGRTLVPVRFVSEAFDCNVEWNANTQTVYINSLSNSSNYESPINSGTNDNYNNQNNRNEEFIEFGQME